MAARGLCASAAAICARTIFGIPGVPLLSAPAARAVDLCFLRCEMNRLWIDSGVYGSRLLRGYLFNNLAQLQRFTVRLSRLILRVTADHRVFKRYSTACREHFRITPLEKAKCSFGSTSADPDSSRP